MTSVARPSHSIRLRGRSFLALVLAPEKPVSNWLGDLDAWLRKSPGFFSGRPVVVDVSALAPTEAELAAFVADLNAREIRILGIEGTDASRLGPGMPPLLNGGRPAGVVEALDPALAPAPAAASARAPVKPAAPQPASLLIDAPVRSGQSVVFPEGDVIVVGSVASGAEVIAGGSIHVYGTLRGRAIAGSAGDARARIFCRRLEAELLAIDGLYKTADDVASDLRGRAVHAWLAGDAIIMTALD